MWEIKQLGEVCDFQGGAQPPKSQFSNEIREGYIRLLQIRDFKSDDKAVYVKKTSKLRICNNEDIMIGRYGASVGQIHTGKSGAYNVALIKTIPNKNQIDKEYLYWYLKSDLFQTPLSKVAERSAQAGFSKPDIAPFEISLPPIPEQKRIVAILSDAFVHIDTATANTKKTIITVHEMFDSTLNKIFTQRGEEWVEKRLSNVTSKIGSGATPRGGSESYQTDGISLIRSLNIYDHEFIEEKLAYIDDKQAKKLDNVIVEENDVLFNITGASVARCCVVPSRYLPARVNQHVSIIRPHKNTLNSVFLCYMLTSQIYKKVLLGIGEEGGSTRQAITKAQLQNLLISFPLLDQQNSIVERLIGLANHRDMLISNYTQKLANLQELKQSLLNQAFSGKLTADKQAA